MCNNPDWHSEDSLGLSPTQSNTELREIVEIVHGDKCPLAKPCPVVNQGIRAIEECIQAREQQLLDELLGELPEQAYLGKKPDLTPNARNGWNNCLDQVTEIIKLKQLNRGKGASL